jgi:hypothetical protein
MPVASSGCAVPLVQGGPSTTLLIQGDVCPAVRDGRAIILALRDKLLSYQPGCLVPAGKEGHVPFPYELDTDSFCYVSADADPDFIIDLPFQANLPDGMKIRAAARPFQG